MWRPRRSHPIGRTHGVSTSGRLSLTVVLCTVAYIESPRLFAQDEAAFRVVTNEANPVSTLSRGQVSRIFFRKTLTWDDGRQMAPVDQMPNSAARQAFSRTIHGKAVQSVQAYWMQLLYSGRAVPPPELGSDADVIVFVKSNPGAIGYVSSSASSGGVKVLEVK